jgi:hypothetical protein
MLYDRDTCYMAETHAIWQRHMLYDRDTCYMTDAHAKWQRHMLYDRDTCYMTETHATLITSHIVKHFITLLISSNFNHCIVCLSLYSFWLPLPYLLITPFIPSDYSFHTFWLPLSYLLITPFIPYVYSFHTFWLLLSYLLITSLEYLIKVIPETHRME